MKVTNIEFLLRKQTERDGIPTGIYTPAGECVFSADTVDGGAELSIRQDVANNLIGYYMQVAHPLVAQDDCGLLFGILRALDGLYCIWGPFAEISQSKAVVMAVSSKYGVHSKNLPIQEASLFDLICDIEIAALLLTGEQITGDSILRASIHQSSSTLLEEAEIDNYQFSNSENDISHLSYRTEKMIMDAARNGDVEFIKSRFSDLQDGRIGILANSQMKQLEYMTVSGITLMTRAAIEGGMSPAEAYRLSDLWLQKLEQCKNSVEIMNLSTNAVLDIVGRVEPAREQKADNPLVEQCKEYIRCNIYRSLRTDKMAETFGVNRSHLSTVFKEAEGIGIKEYVMNERLRIACNMLRYSEESIATISDCLCFSSQSHFGKAFRKKMHMSPSEYRQKNKLHDALE